MDLQTQANKLIQYHQQHYHNKDFTLIQDIGSRLNFNKKGLNSLIELILSSSIDTLIINHKDRLLRFGAEIIFKLCQHYKVNVIIIEQPVNHSFEQELASTVIEIMTWKKDY